jgi:ferredoxin hydrogenase
MTVVTIDQDICTGCQECTKVCPVFAIEGNPHEPQKIVEDRCVFCGQCVQKCKSYISLVDHPKGLYEQKRKERGLPESVTEPLFAAYNVPHIQELLDAMAAGKFTMVQSAPAVRVSLAEDFGMPLGSLTPGKMAAALRKLGFNKVYDTNFSADLTIMEEGTELVNRVTKGGALPQFTSCCPAWVRYFENNYPELTKHLSTAKSPQQMQGAVFKTYGAKICNVKPEDVYSVSIMPCTCKEYESSRPEFNSSGYRDVDVVLTTRELGYLIKMKGIDFDALPEEEFDKPLGEYTGAAAIFGVTGGVMEAALRSGYFLITGKELPDPKIEAVRGPDGFRTASVPIQDGLTLKVGIVVGLKNVEPVMEKLKAGELKDYHFIEVMTCPQGCISGGGQCKIVNNADVEEAYKDRTKAIYNYDEELPIRCSHQNPDITKIYSEYFKEPCGELSHHLLHTTYKGCEGAHH